MNSHVAEQIEKDYSYLENFYKDLHQNPELSFYEKETSEKLAKELEQLGINVTRNIGGYGIVGAFCL